MTQDLMQRLRAGASEPEIQAGSRGMDVRDVVAAYCDSPGVVVSLLREIRNISVDELSSATSIAVKQIEAIEAGHQKPLPNQCVSLAKALQADLRVLMDVFDTTQRGASTEPMGIAAQFRGEMSDEQKQDLRQIIGSFKGGGGEGKP